MPIVRSPGELDKSAASVSNAIAWFYITEVITAFIVFPASVLC